MSTMRRLWPKEAFDAYNRKLTPFPLISHNPSVKFTNSYLDVETGYGIARFEGVYDANGKNEWDSVLVKTEYATELGVGCLERISGIAALVDGTDPKPVILTGYKQKAGTVKLRLYCESTSAAPTYGVCVFKVDKTNWTPSD